MPELIDLRSSHFNGRRRPRLPGPTKGPAPTSPGTGAPARYAADPLAFTVETLGLTPDPVQARLLDLSIKRGILNCARQWGKSTIAAARAIHQAVFFPGSLILVVAPTERQSGELVQKIREFARRLELPVKGDRQHASAIVLGNGSRVLPLPGTEATNRGYSAPALVLVDEAAFLPDEVFDAITPTLATADGAMWLMSTPFGRRGFFYKTYIAGGGRWTRIQVTGPECPRIRPEHLAEQQARLPAAVFAQEYLCEFNDSEQAALSTSLLLRAVRTDVGPLFPGGDPYGRWDRTGFDPEARYYLGVDLGQRENYTALSLVEARREPLGVRDPLTFEPRFRETRAVRHLERVALGTSYIEVAEYVRYLVRHPAVSGRVELVVDASGVGLPVVELMRRQGLGARLTPVTITGGNQETATGVSVGVPRRDLILRLLLAIEKEQVGIAEAMPGTEALLGELAGLEVRYGGTGRLRYEPGGDEKQDDLTMATALAWWAASRPTAGLRSERLLAA